MNTHDNHHHSPEEQSPQARPEGPPSKAPPPATGATVKVAYARWLAERVLQGIESDSETVRNTLYWLANADLALAEVVCELLRDRPPVRPAPGTNPDAPPTAGPEGKGGTC